MSLLVMAIRWGATGSTITRERKAEMLELLRKLHKEESGQDLIEYALIAALIAVASVAAMGALANKISAEFNKVGTQLS